MLTFGVSFPHFALTLNASAPKPSPCLNLPSPLALFASGSRGRSTFNHRLFQPLFIANHSARRLLPSGPRDFTGIAYQIASLAFSCACALFVALCALEKNYLSSFQLHRDSFAKIPGVGYPDSFPLVPSDVSRLPRQASKLWTPVQPRDILTA